MSQSSADVLIAGGGPAGAATAAWLARRGVNVLVVERAAFPREKPCAEFMSPGVVDALDRLGAWEAVRSAAPAHLRGMEVHAGDAHFTLSYASRQGARSAIAIARPIFDQVLLDHARRQGARVQERSAVLGTVIEGSRVVGLQVRTAEGAATLRAQVVVGADGLHSTVARSLGLDVPSRWPRRLGLVARYVGPHGLEECGQMHVGGRLYCGLAPLNEQFLNVGLVTRLRDRRGGEATEAYFDRRLAQLPEAAAILAPLERRGAIRGMGPLARRVRNVAGPGYLLVGDAAGFLDPFTGEGVYRALRGAELAGPAIEAALGRADRVPIGYAAARRAAFGDKERVCSLAQLFLASRNVFSRVVGQLAARPPLARQLAGVLGDYEPASVALQPAFLWALLRP
ncbi:MAG: hypothetical protein QOF51_3202 [Chloroflexota bacterium]|nr:hypothetical protein [Chloroflexota bacterium]